ncbi:hypothetical protein WJT74_08150 [Sphingomicrobium sp. XHP0239]|uniref:hypothetical protein n=1 Tax=Sphingomicrobium maritimum TaxID=3133972 RepID=UPI0031CC6122
MSQTVEALGMLIRRLLTFALLPIGLFVAFGFVAISNATLDATALEAYSIGAIVLLFHLLAAAGAWKAATAATAWFALVVGWTPTLYLAFS